jgi:hypothetical protein
MNAEAPISLSKKAILEAQDSVKEAVDMRPYGWPGHVYVISLTGAGRDAWESSLLTFTGKKSKPDLANARAKLLTRCLCDQNGQLLFEEHEVEALGRKSAKALDYLYDVARRLSGIGEEEVKELVKNSESAQTESSSCA